MQAAIIAVATMMKTCKDTLTGVSTLVTLHDRYDTRWRSILLSSSIHFVLSLVFSNTS